MMFKNACRLSTKYIQIELGSVSNKLSTLLYNNDDLMEYVVP